MTSAKTSIKIRRFPSLALAACVTVPGILWPLQACRTPAGDGREGSDAGPGPAALKKAPPLSEKQEEPAADDHDPCAPVPESMACIPAGAFVMGENDREDSLPEHEVFVDAFFIDRFEVTQAQYRECVKAGACEKKLKYKGFISDDQPMVPATWYDAQAYCRWAGKRLPTEAEWENAARGPAKTAYPWGGDPPSCDRAVYNDCELPATLAVGSFPPNGYGLYDMAGNSYEWVQDWYAPCLEGCEKACGEACLGPNPLGPCRGTAPCKGFGLKVLKGGSWYWGKDALRAAHRRAMLPDSGVHRLGFRCAMDPEPVQASAGAPEPLDEKTRQIFLSSAEDEVPEQRVDERHYVHSNENAHYLFFRYIDHAGGGYVGVGSDQNYTLIAAGRPELAWIVDYDPVVVLLHRIHRAFILDSESPEGFLSLWREERRDEALALIRKAEKENPDLGAIEGIYEKHRKGLEAYFTKVISMKKKGTPVTWLSDPEAYGYVRGMYAQGRIRPMVCNLLGEKALKGIGAAASELGITIRTVYLTNVEEFIAFNSHFVESFASMPFDDKSVILRTMNSEWGYERADYKWHYNIQGAKDFVDRITKGVRRVQTILKNRQPTGIKGVTTVAI